MTASLGHPFLSAIGRSHCILSCSSACTAQLPILNWITFFLIGDRVSTVPRNGRALPSISLELPYQSGPSNPTFAARQPSLAERSRAEKLSYRHRGQTLW